MHFLRGQTRNDPTSMNTLIIVLPLLVLTTFGLLAWLGRPFRNTGPARPFARTGWGAVLLTSIPTALLVALATNGFKHYGYGLFMAIPLVAGFIATLLYDPVGPWTWPRRLAVVTATLLATGAWLVSCKLEGLICLYMAALLGWALAVVGLLLATLFRFLTKSRRHDGKVQIALWTLVPLLAGMETKWQKELTLRELTTSVEVDTPPEAVWRYIPQFADIPEAPTGLLATGIAFPLRSEMEGQGIGAVRRCVLSTGSMEERVTVWEPSWCLEFAVLSVPPAMKEASFYDEVHSPHNEGFFQPERGRFVLTSLPDGRTRIDGTSWYRHALWPEFYWRPITDQVVRQVHARVLGHIKSLAENDARQE